MPPISSIAQTTLALARAQARSLPRYNAGLSARTVRERFGVERIVKLASNENPLGASPRVARALAGIADQVALYPDAGSHALRQAVAAQTGIDNRSIVVGNGSENILELLCAAFITDGDHVVTVVPSFGLHEIYPRLMGARVTLVRVDDTLHFDVGALETALRAGPVKMLVFSNPSNPVGCQLGRAEFDRVLAAAPDDCLLVIDEAYYEYAVGDPDYPDSLSVLARQARPWIVLRTLSKAYGLAGLRVGYGLCGCPELANLLDAVRGPFNINVAAQCAATAALGDPDHVAASVAAVARERRDMLNALRDMGLSPAPSHANFIFVDVGDDSQRVAEALLHHGVIVKPWREAGYERFIRVSVGCAEDNRVFLDALRRELAR